MEDEISIVLDNSMINKVPNVLDFIKIDEPIFYATLYMESIFLSYVLQDRNMIRGNEIIDIKEMVAIETSFDTVIDLLNRKISIYESIEKAEQKYKKGKIGDKLFPMKKVLDISEISNKIPKKSYKLELQENMVSEYLKIIDTRKKRLEGYDSNKWDKFFIQTNSIFDTKKVNVNSYENKVSRGIEDYEIFDD